MYDKIHNIMLLDLMKKKHISFTLLLLFLLGSHWLDYSLYLFVGMSIFLIDWKQVTSKTFIVLAIFIVSTYITWIFAYYRFIPESAIRFSDLMHIFSQGALILVMYLLGSSIHLSSSIQYSLLSEKRIFYLLFIFFIAYTLSIAYSYFFIPQDIHLFPDKAVPNGMHVWFQNEYSRIHMHEGRLISTIIAYYLIFTAILLPFLLFGFKQFRERAFSYGEWLFLLLVSVFSLYISNIMGRRTVLLLFIVVFVYFVLLMIIKYMKRHNTKVLFGMLGVTLLLAGAGYYTMSDTAVFQRLSEHGFHDRRFGFWVPGLKAMLAYPFGGAHEISVAHGMKLAHNTWIDIGKDYGIIPFVTFVLFCIMHIFYILKVLFSHLVQPFIKHQIVIISISLFIIMMIEPVFNSDKTFFSYTMFFLGYVRRLSITTKI